MIWLISAFCCVAFPCVALAVMSLFAKTPTHLGVRNGRLAPCPASPNCVSTQAETQQHWIAPLTPEEGEESPVARIAEIIAGMPGATVVEQKDDYLRAEFRSLIFRFCDDVEFYHDKSGGQIHFRSASRVGHSDLGVNRKRMEEIRGHFRRGRPKVGKSASTSGARNRHEHEMVTSGSF
jgi:uncharacterized protein (DUF1499 family)